MKNRIVRMSNVICRSSFIIAGAATLVAGLAANAPAEPARPTSRPDATLDVGNRRQLLIDGRFFAQTKDVVLVVHPPVKTRERTIAPEKPWESDGIGNNATVIKDGDVYHMWYPADPGLCYARSKDGIRFEKPNLGLTEFKGSRDNNIVVGGGAGGIDKCSTEGMVFIDPTAPADQRFRYATRISDELKDTVVFSSPDGIHFRQTHSKVLAFTHPENRQHLDSQNVIFWDDRIGKYVAYMRFNQHKKGFRGRSVARAESDHLGGFSQVQDSPVVFGPDSLDVNFDGHPSQDYYTSAAMKYPWAQDAYFMFPQAYFHYQPGRLSEFPQACPANAGPLDTQFAAGRDGITWQRFDRKPFVRLGFPGEFDSKNARVFCGLVPSVDGREMYMYYLGSDQLHGWGRDEKNNRLLTEAGLAPGENTSLISRLVLRRDGFVSATFACEGGEFTTPPLTFAGRELAINVDTSATGLLRCEILDRDGRPIEGFTLADCDWIHTANDINRVVKWKRNADVSSLAGKPVRLRFVSRNTDVYAFQFR